jgi:uncharacterized protein with PIN domain
MTASGYTAAERTALARAAARGEALLCPVCGAELSRQVIEPRVEVSYVRRRLWLLCPRCRRAASIDIRAGGPP